jgi:hypothetical protein
LETGRRPRNKVAAMPGTKIQGIALFLLLVLVLYVSTLGVA